MPKKDRKKPGAPLPGAGPKPAVEETRELRDYVEIQEKVNRGLRTFISEMTIVFRFIETVSTFHALDRILDLLLDVMKELCGYDAAAVYLHTAGDARSEHIPKLAYREEEIARYRQKLELDERIYSWVYRQGHAVIVPESFMRRGVRQGDTWSYMIAPLATTTERIGRIEMVFKRAQGTFTQQTFSILNVLLKHASVILLNERVYAKERSTSKKYIELDMLKQDVVNTTTHEIKTPLTIIQAAGILLKRQQRMPRPEREQLLDKIVYQCGRIDQIVSELFETSQLDDNQPLLHPEALSLRLLTQAVLKDIHYDTDRIRLNLRFPSGVHKIKGDRSSLYKVLRNLVENAVKYSPQGGDIEISAANQGRKVRWQVQDHGVGISEEDQKKIFDKFFRAGASSTRSVRGMGFGLYLVKKNVEANKGSIRVESQPQSGSTFILEFPAHLSRK